MRLWYINHYASTPDQQTTGAFFLMQTLAKFGHEVEIFASGFSYYLRKDIRLDGRWFSRDQHWGKVVFHWIRSTPTTGRMLSRLANMLSFSVIACAVGLFRKPAPDIVIASCPHPFAGFVGWVLAKRYNARFIYEIRDIWPESLLESKHFNKKLHLFAAVIFKLQMFLYRRADIIISVLPKCDEYLLSKGIKPKCFLWLPNGITFDKAALPSPDIDPVNDRFTVFYLGGHSKYQGLDTLVDVALLLKQKNIHDIKLVLMGEGTEKQRLKERARLLELDNIEFRDAVPRTEVLKTAVETNCYVMHMGTLEAFRYGVSPNKLCDYMLAGRPIIYAVGGEGSNPVEDAHAGVTIPPQTPAAMLDAILQLRALSAQQRREMGMNAQTYGVNNYDMEKIAKKLDDALIA